MKTIVLTAAAAKQLLGLPAEVQQTIESALNRYAIDGIGDVTALKGSDAYRLRVGRYRVLFDEDALTILAIYIGQA